MAWDAAYRAVFRARRFDEIAVALQRQGFLNSYAEARGQEVGQVGAALALQDRDMVFPSFRQPGVALLRGVEVTELLRFYAGESHCPWDWRSHKFAAFTIPVGSQLAHAVGWAWAASKQRLGEVVLVFFGDGASSQGEVHEAMNFAGVVRAPVIFLCENNGWAISLPTRRQTAASELFRRAEGYGFQGLRVDGNDIEAVHSAVADCATRARAGGGPTLIEAVTYRLGAHTTSDDPAQYRAQAEWESWRARDPVRMMAENIREFRYLGENQMSEIEEAVNGSLDRAVDKFLEEHQEP
jgi:2-oxoisovalerate dehydrogenase E1 component alpha subunit